MLQKFTIRIPYSCETRTVFHFSCNALCLYKVFLFLKIAYLLQNVKTNIKIYSKRLMNIIKKSFIITCERLILVNKKQQLLKRIQHKELQIKKLHLHQESNDVCNQLYNTLILEKAILNKELKEIDKNPIIEAVKKAIPRREKLICDYFKG